jgi:hypothetical protein
MLFRRKWGRHLQGAKTGVNPRHLSGAFKSGFGGGGASGSGAVGNPTQIGSLY